MSGSVIEQNTCWAASSTPSVAAELMVGNVTPASNDGGIDGKKLTELMIQYDLGVSIDRDISIKRVDNDYLER